jgi:hypothetical protein
MMQVIKQYRYLLLFILLSVFLDKLLGEALRYLYFNQKSGSQYKTIYATTKTKADVLVFGSSKAHYHYVSDIFSSRLGKSFYNAGSDGQNIFFHLALNKIILNRYKPQIILLDIIPNELEYQQASYERTAALLPYYKDYKEVRPIIDMNGSFERIKLLSGIYPFNSNILTIAMGNLGIGVTERDDACGSGRLNRVMDTSQVKESDYGDRNRKVVVDPQKITAFEEFILNTRAHGVELYVVISPIYGLTEAGNVYGPLFDIIDKYKVKVFNFISDEELQNFRYYADINHLNAEGALLFSRMVADSLLSHPSAMLPGLTAR